MSSVVIKDHSDAFGWLAHLVSQYSSQKSTIVYGVLTKGEGEWHLTPKTEEEIAEDNFLEIVKVGKSYLWICSGSDGEGLLALKSFLDNSIHHITNLILSKNSLEYLTINTMEDFKLWINPIIQEYHDKTETVYFLFYTIQSPDSSSYSIVITPLTKHDGSECLAENDVVKLGKATLVFGTATGMDNYAEISPKLASFTDTVRNSIENIPHSEPEVDQSLEAAFNEMDIEPYQDYEPTDEDEEEIAFIQKYGLGW